jgi:hypothetical protein
MARQINMRYRGRESRHVGNTDDAGRKKIFAPHKKKVPSALAAGKTILFDFLCAQLITQAWRSTPRYNEQGLCVIVHASSYDDARVRCLLFFSFRTVWLPQLMAPGWIDIVRLLAQHALLRRYLCLCVCVFVCLCLLVSVSVFVFVSVRVCVCVCMPLYVCGTS